MTICVLLMTLMVAGCEKSDPAPDTYQEYISSQTIEELTPPLGLQDSKVTDFDSLREELLSFILPTPDTRALDLWYGQRSRWVPRLGSSENLLQYIEFIFKEQVRDGEMIAAISAKLATGRINYLNAQYPEAVDEFHEALEISTNISDSSMVGWSYLSLSAALLQIDEMEKSEEYMVRALELAGKINNENLEIFAIMTKAGVQIHTGRSDTAKSSLIDVITRSRERGMAEMEKVGLLNLGFYNIITEDYDEAIRLLKGNPILYEGRPTLVTAINNLNLYEAYVGKRDYDQAYEYLLDGSRQSDSLGFAFGQVFSKKSMAEHYEREGKYDMALKAYKEYHLVREEQTGEKAQREIRSLKLKQEFREKDWKIERLVQAEQESALEYENRRNLMLGLLVLLGLGFLFSYLYLQFKARVKHANQNKTIAETRLQVLQSQINPHFIFNAITGIQNSILKSEPFDAYNYLGKFSSILRVMATTATSVGISLNQEIELINNYLALEKLRFRDGFVYSVGSSQDLVDIHFQIPGMLVQPIVENAIVHGVSNLPHQGKVDVFFQSFGDGVKVIVSDNGRGRKEASIISKAEGDQHLSIATENANDTLKVLHVMGYTDANITTLDLFNENGTPAGTQVTIYLPFIKV